MKRRRRRNPDIDLDKSGIINMYDAIDAPSLWWFQFGAYAGTNVFVFAGPGHRALEDALEEAAAWLEENAPGHIVTNREIMDLVREVLEEQGKTEGEWQRALEDRDEWAYEVQEEATADLTYTEAGYLTSHEWFVNELQPGDDLYNKVWETTIDYLSDEGDLDDDDINRVNKQAQKMGLDVEWEMEPEANPRQNISIARRHDLPNKDFAVPENEGLPIDTKGRTRAAMARFNQYEFDSGSQAKRAYGRILARAKRFGIDAAHFASEYRPPFRLKRDGTVK